MLVRPLRRPIVLVVCTVLAATLGLVGLPTQQRAEAAVRNPFTPVFQSNENGAIAITGNSQMSCATAATGCAAARNGTASGDASNNNGQVMQFIDIDGAAFPTTNSTSADLALPAGSTVLNARLVWSARRTAGANGAAATGNIQAVSLRAPGQAAYSTVNATAANTYTPTLGTTDAGVYQAAADVTAQVQAAGSGTYFVGDIKAGTGADRFAGWSLVVAYRNPALPLRNLVVFQGFADVTSETGNNNVTIPISGFRTPGAGTVNASVGVVAWEGDQNNAGDALRFNGSTLSDAVRPSNNFFTSRISNQGSSITARNPNYLNNLGVDMGVSSANGLLANNQTSTDLQATTAGDFYYPGIVTTQIDLFSPKFPEVTKSVVNLSGGTSARPGDTLEYTAAFPNSGGDNAANSVMRDVLPTGTSYVPGSLQVSAGANAGAKTDAAGDDQGEYVAGSRTVQVRLGTGANATTGGTIAPNATTTVKFRVTVDRAAAGTTLNNTALLDYRAVALEQNYTFTGNTVATPVTALADLGITKTSTPASQTAGSRVTYDLTVSNSGPNAATGAVVTDTLPAGVTFVSAEPTAGTCGASGSTVTCQLGTVANGATVTIPVVVDVAPGTAAGTLVNRASVAATTADDVPANNTATAATQVTRSADLATTLTGPAEANAGEEVTWTATVTNNGPSTATATQLTDLLPPGATFVSADTPDGGTCTNANNQVSCSFGDLAPGQSRTVTVVGRIDAGATPATVVNVATASTTTPESVTANNRAEVSTTLAQLADLEVSKTPSAASVVAGGRARFTVQVTNNGPSDATQVTLDDPAVAGYTVTTANSSQGTCEISGDGDVVCSLGRITPGSSATVQVVGDVAPTRAGGPLVNTATAATVTPDADPDNDSADGTVQVTTSADLFLTKSATPNPVVAGEQLTYTLTTGNNGPSQATGVEITDVLPDGVTFDADANEDCTADGDEVTCPVGTLAVGATASVQVVVDVAGSVPPGGIENTATVDADTTDPAEDNNTASFLATTEATADLSLTKTTSPTPLVAGQPVTYTVVATNDGPSDAVGVVVTDEAPAGVTFTGATTDPDVDGDCTVTAGEVSCPVGTLADGDSITVTITGTVAATALGATSNTAEVTAETPDDPSEANNSASSSTFVTTSADLGVVLAGPDTPVRAGEEVDYTLTVTNTGPSVARNVVVTGQVPDNLTPVLGSSEGLCEVVGQTVTCRFPTLPPDFTDSLTFTALVNSDAPAGPVPGTASVGSSALDTNPANDESTATLEVVTEADLALTKTVTPDPLIAGDVATYTLSVANDGPSDATDVEITDVLPAELAVQGVSPSLGTCEIDGQTVDCTVDTLTAGSTAVVNVQVLVDAAATGTVINDADVVTATTDPVPGNDAATIETDVLAAADLELFKSVDADPLVAGTAATYTLTAVNNGPSVAADVVLDDPLPAGLTILPGGIDAGGADCSASTDTSVSCALGDLAPGASATVSVRALVGAGTDDGDEVANAAELTSPTPVADPDGSPRAATVTRAVAAQADLSLVKGAASDSPTAGTTQRYTVTVTNNGPSDAVDTVITDVLPDGLTFTGSEVEDGTCTADGQTVECELGTLAPGDIVTVTIDADLDDDLAGTTLTNQASVSTATDDPVTGNDTAEQVSTVAGSSDLDVAKTVTSGPVVAGEEVEYALEVTNAGPSSTGDVRLVDTLPAGVEYVSASADGGECSFADGAVTCVWPSLAVGANPLTATVTVAVPAGVQPGTTLTNSATATSSNPDPTQTPAVVDSTVGRSADLSVEKSLLEAPVAGEPVRWLVTVSNDGPSDAAGVTLSDPAPDGVTFTSADPAQGSCTVTDGQVDCDLGTLADQASVAVTLVGDLDPGFDGDTLVNTATAGPDTDDPETDNNSGTSTSPVATAADLTITKTADPGTATAGEELTYTLTATNGGPSTATGVRILDTLPAGFEDATAVLTDPGLGTCALEGSALDCTVPSLADGQSAVVEVTGTVTSGFAAAELVNRASVESGTEDPDRSDDDVTLPTPVQTSADLAVTTTAPASATAGTPISWDVLVENLGPSDAQGVVLTTELPADVGSVTATVGGQPCTLDGTTLTCTLGTLPAGADLTITISGVVDPDSTATELAITATATTTTDDPVADNDSAGATTTVAAAADLQVTKTALTGTFTAGERVSWRIDVRNDGPSTARAVELTDALPAALSAVSTDSDDCTVTGTDVACALGDVAASTTSSVVVSGLLDPGYTGADLANSATATSSTTDPTPGDSTGTSTTDVEVSSDLRVGKRLVGDAVAGQEVTFEVVATNDGPSDATGVVITDTLPDEVTPTGGTVPGGTCVVDGQDVTCTLDGPLPAGDPVTATVTGTLDAGSDGTLTNDAAVASTSADPVTQNNATSIELDPDVAVDLSVTNAAPTTVVAGADITWTVTVSNAGPSDATSVQLTDVVPAGVTGVTATVDGVDCTVEDGVVTCPLGALASGDSVVVTVTGTVAASFLGDALTATATVEGPDDVDSTNNTAPATTTVTTAADVTVTKTADPESLTAGGSGAYVLTVANDGPSDAQVVQLSDVLPAGLTLTGDADAEQGDCTAAGTAVSCELGTVAAGDSLTVRIPVALDSSYTAATVVNTATVTSPTDAGTDGNSDTLTSDVARTADLEVTKTGPETTVAGEPLSWTITVANDGPSSAEDVVLTDTLPEDLGEVSVLTSIGSCDPVDGTILECALGDLAAGAEATVTISVVGGLPVDYATGAITNSVEVDSSTGDVGDDQGGPEGRTDEVETVVEASADLNISKVPTGGVVSFAPGTEVSWTITVGNAGPSTARDVVVDETDVDGVTGLTLRDPDGQPCDDLSCELGDLAPGATVVLTATGQLPAGSELDFVANTATVSSDTDDPTAGDDEITSTVPVLAGADLSVTKEATTDTVTAGEQVSWTITATSTGPSLARDVVLTDPLPAGLTGISVEAPDDVDCSTDGDLSCTIPTLGAGAGEAVRITVTATVPADFEGPLTNTVSLASATPDADPSNNSDTATTTVETEADLVVEKTGPDSVVAGQTVSWDLSIANEGPSTARDVVLTDVVPAGVTDVQVGPEGVDCTVTGSTVTCTVDELAPGADPFEVTVTGTVAATTTGALVNTATATSTTSDGDGANNSDTTTTTVGAEADLVVTKTADPTTLVPGQPATFTVTVDNVGSSVARSVTLTDVVDPAFTVTGATGPGCTAGGTVVCDLGDLAPTDEPVTVTITVDVPAGYEAGTFTNSATATSPTPDATPADNTGSVGGPVTGSADVSVVKTVEPGTLQAGEPATFTLTVDNAGPSTARDVLVTDLVDPALEVTGVTTAAGECTTRDDGLVSCELGDLAPDADPVVVTIEVDVPPGYDADSFANSAVVTSATPDPDTENNTGQVSGPAAAVADVAVTITPTAGDGTPGTDVTWEVVVTNNGPATSRGTAVVVAVPEGVDIDSITGDGVECDVDSRLCTIGDLAPGQSVTITVEGTVAEDYDATTLPATASVTSLGNDPVTANNTATATLTATGSADLSLVKTVEPGTLQAGEPATFTLTVDNAGPSTARDVRVIDPVDPALEVTDVTSSTGECTTGEDGLVDCDLGDLSPGADPVTITVEVDVPADYAADAFSNSAVVSSATPDPATADNTGQVSGPAAAAADVAVTITPVTGTPTPGGPISWSVVVTNNGPATAAGTTLVVAVPDGVDLDSITGPGVECDVETRLCTIGDLAPGQSVTISVEGTLDAGFTGTSVTATAAVTSTTADPVTGNNTAAAATPVVGAADLTVTKESEQESVSPGEEATWTVTVQNTGPSVARSVTVVDDLPAGVTLVSVDGDDVDCGPASGPGGTLTCVLGDLGVDETVVFDVTGAVAADLTGASVVNTVLATSATPDPDAADNQATSPVALDGSADLVVAKEATGPLTAGQPGSWLVTVTNDGPAVARDVVVTDQLPPGATTAAAEGCEVADRTLTCPVAELAPGQTVEITVTADVAAGAAAELTNVATATSSTPEADVDDNTASTTDPVARVSDLRLEKTADRPDAVQGEVVTWTIAVTNDGPSNASGVVVTEQWPDGAQLLEAVAERGEYDPAAGTWRVGTLADGETVRLALSARLLASGEVRNTATVGSDSTDPELADNQAGSTVEAEPGPTPPPPPPTGEPTPPPTGEPTPPSGEPTPPAPGDPSPPAPGDPSPPAPGEPSQPAPDEPSADPDEPGPAPDEPGPGPQDPDGPDGPLGDTGGPPLLLGLLGLVTLLAGAAATSNGLRGRRRGGPGPRS